jgi:hypothetical protein
MKIKNKILMIALVTVMLACSVLNTPAAPVDLPASATVPVAAEINPTFTPISTFTPSAPTSPPPTPILSQLLTMESVPFSETGNAPPYTITAQIPFLQGPHDARVTAFNMLLNQTVQDEINQFRSDTLAFAPNPPLAAGSSFDLTYSVIGQRGDVWSLKFDISIYVDGAAHPAHYSTTLNYDLQNGSVIYLDQLFFPGSPYLQVVSDYCKAQLAARDIGFDMFSAGADPLPENYQRWNISDAGLTITFDEYQVAPYAAGPQIVVIPFAELQGSINPQSAAGLFIQ